ncbi:MAG: PQQ-dependent sugar dehydrogenase [Akkermansiaceae bacterium]
MSSTSVKAQTIADAAADYVSPTTLPAGWEYFLSSEANGSTLTALASNQAVGNLGRIGFGGTGNLNSACIMGSGSPYELYSTAAHNGVAGEDLLIQPGNGTDDDYIIARYEFSSADLIVSDTVKIFGSFRDLQSNTSTAAQDSVIVFIYHNSTLLFSAEGADSVLTEANGTFELSGVVVSVGDTISFVVGNNGIYNGDETALKAQIEHDNSASSLTFSDTAPSGGWQFPDAFPGLTFTQPTCLEKIPGNTESLFVTERSGNIYVIPDVTATTPTKSLFLDISNVRTQTFCGLRGLAFHPDFENNRYFYVGYDSTANFDGENNSVRVSRFTANADLSTVNSSTEVVLFQQGTNQNIHRINQMVFGPDGYLYIAVGDDGNSTGPAHSQRIDDDFWSSVLRIDVDKKSGNYEPINTDGVTLDGSGLAYYSIPADNPYIDQNFSDGRGVTTFNGQPTVTGDATAVRTEMYCVGFRNPWKIGFVPVTGELWVADAAAAGYEKICVMPAGGNAGWGHLEGTGAGPLQVGSGSYSSPLSDPPSTGSYIQPVLEYTVPGNTATGGVKSIVGGTYYTATDIPDLTGAFVFADYTKGDIWYMKRPNNSAYQTVGRVAIDADGDGNANEWGMDETGMVTEVISASSGFEAKSYEVSEIERIGSEAAITAMLTDPSDGSVLMLDYQGIIRRIEYNVDDGSLPAILSETGAFDNLSNLTPSEGVKPYSLNLRFWSDHADKSRFFALKTINDTFTYSEDGLWGAPEGAVFVKHFDMDLDLQNPGTNVQRLETRFLVKTADDFYGVSYRWNTAQTDADLVDTGGDVIPLVVTEADGSTRTQDWKIPSRGDCRTCHTNDNGVMLGFNTRQLNRQGTLNGIVGNYLERLYDEGYLDIGTEAAPVGANLSKYHTPDDTSVNLEVRARSYIAVNCSYCHYEGTNSISVGDAWKGDPFLSIEDTNLFHGEGIGFAVVDPTDRYVIPGDADNSMIYNLAAEDNSYGRMPPLATDIVDDEGVALLRDWINNFANTKPTLDAAAGPYSVLENSSSSTVVGIGPQATDLDDPDPDRGILTYSIIDGNDDGYYEVDFNTGELSLVDGGADFEKTPVSNLSILVSDNFAPNPGELTTSVTVNLIDVVNDDSQGDGIIDEYAVAEYGTSDVDPTLDLDDDGFSALLEFWANSDPSDPHSRGLILLPYQPTADGYSFEWTIRADVTLGTDYFVQGSSDMNFTQLTQDTDFTIVSNTTIPGSPTMSKVLINVLTTDKFYFLRLSNKAQSE